MGEPLTPEQWAAVSRLLGEVLELPERDRAAWLDALPEPDASFRPVLGEMLARDETPGFLNTLPRIDDRGASHGGPEPGSMLGPYRLIRELGHGGMGTVWLAERADGTLKRAVALKLPHPGLHNRHFLERFDRERDILAALSHPNIATLYDAGVDNGQPYLALEYVEGATIVDYCSRAGLSVRERLWLFLQVIGAVQYAHAHLVVHRDLKPSNILVTPEGQVKLLDFGIAKLLGEGEGAATELTEAGGRLLTPDYASPEQIRGQPVSTASDVYALGTVLYELLAGEHPWKRRRETRGSLEEAVLSADPCRPSEAAGASRKLAAGLRGDLDSIVLKALRKQPAERYPTANSFSQDIERYLAGEAVSARPDSTWYVARKFLSRHKLAAASAAAIVLALTAGLSVALWQAHIARTQTRTAAAVEKFLEDIFRANSSDQPDPVKARQTTARELLDIGARKIDGELAGVPEAKLHVLDTLGSMYADLGLSDQAVTAFRKSVSLARTLYGNDAPALAEELMRLANALHASQSVNEREAVLLEAKRILDRKGDFTSRSRGMLLWNLAQHYQSSDLATALEYSRQGVKVLRAHPPSADLTEALEQCASIHQVRGEHREAEPLFTEAIAVSAKLAGNPNPDLVRLYAYQGDTQQRLLKFAAAEDSLRHALSVALNLNGQDHVDTLETELRLGLFLCASSRPREGLEHIERAKDIVLRTRGAADPFYAPQVLLEYGWELALSGRLEEGLTYISQAIENRRKNRPGTRYLGQMLEYQAQVFIEMGREADARKLVDEAAAISQKVNVQGSYVQTEDRVRLLIAEGRAGETEPAIDACRVGRASAGTLSLDSLNLDLLKAEAALARRDAEAATRLAAQARTELTAAPARPWLKGAESRAALIEGRGDLMLHRAEEALPLLKRAVELRSEVMDQNSPRLSDAQVWLAACYLDLGKRAQAAALVARARAAQASHRELSREYRDPLREVERRLR